jgi:hypothetical protein
MIASFHATIITQLSTTDKRPSAAATRQETLRKEKVKQKVMLVVTVLI